MSHHVQAIRAALKAAGYSARQVTVRDGGLYSAITITIRDGAIKLPDVEATIEPVAPPMFEHYGDGQPFTSAGYRVAYLDAIIRPLADIIEPRIVAATDEQIVTVAPGIRVSVDANRYEVTRWPNGVRCYDIRHAANLIAVDVLSAGTVAATIALGSADDADEWLDRLDLDAA